MSKALDDDDSDGGSNSIDEEEGNAANGKMLKTADSAAVEAKARYVINRLGPADDDL